MARPEEARLPGDSSLHDETCAPDDYWELEARCRERWREVQMDKARRLSQLSQTLAGMPDVLAKPAPLVPWTPPVSGCVCPACGMGQFYIDENGWITINGVLHRWMGRCCLCSKKVCYDLTEQGWAER